MLSGIIECKGRILLEVIQIYCKINRLIIAGKIVIEMAAFNLINVEAAQCV